MIGWTECLTSARMDRTVGGRAPERVGGGVGGVLKDSWMSCMRSVIRKKEGEKNRKVKAPWEAIGRPDDPPLTRPPSRRMSLPATPSIILTPTAEQHLFISSDRWKRACEDRAGEDHQICRPINYEELVQHRPDHGPLIVFPGSATYRRARWAMQMGSQGWEMR